jgi:hypothetical protein
VTVVQINCTRPLFRWGLLLACQPHGMLRSRWRDALQTDIYSGPFFWVFVNSCG